MISAEDAQRLQHRTALLLMLDAIETICGDSAELAGMRLALTRAAMVSYLYGGRSYSVT